MRGWLAWPGLVCLVCKTMKMAIGNLCELWVTSHRAHGIPALVTNPDPPPRCAPPVYYDPRIPQHAPPTHPLQPTSLHRHPQASETTAPHSLHTPDVTAPLCTARLSGALATDTVC